MPARHSILVVDDEPQVIKSLQNLLRLDYRVVRASSATEAMEILQREEIHVVMTDQRMPEMTGVELLRNVHEQHPDVMRLLFTGYADIKSVIDAINNGHVYRYITKPWDPTELQAILRDACAHYELVLDRRRLVEELQQKNCELKQAIQLKSAFIKVASHEFRTPVTILRALSALATLDKSNALDLTDHLSQIDGTTRRLEGLINQTISMLSSERFETVFNGRLEDINAIIRLAAEDVKSFLKIRHQEFEINLDDGLGTMTIDAGKLRDMLNHLLLNAVKFTPDGGTIGVRAYRNDSGLIIEVTDTGNGIAPEALPLLFQPFFTGFDVSRHSSGQYEYGARGLGLGLSVVRAFTQLHGGSITVKSELEKGSQFVVFLPDARSQTALDDVGL